MRQQFRVVLDGVDLSKEETKTLNAAIQKTVISHLAGLDRLGDLAATFRPADGGTNGIVAVPAEPPEELSRRLTGALDGLE